MPSAASPAGLVAQRYGYDLRALGASSVRATTPSTVTATFMDNFKATQAGWAIRNVVDGAKLVVVNKSVTLDTHRPSVEGVKELLSNHPGVNGIGGRTGQQLNVYTVAEKTAGRLRALLLPQLPDKTPVAVTAVGEIRALAVD